MTKDEALREAIDTLKSTKHGNCDFAWIDETLKKCTEALAQPPLPAQEQRQARVDVITVNLMREGIDKHRARELADHFVNFTLTPPLPVQRQPLTDEQVKELLLIAPVYAPNGVVTRTPFAYRKELLDTALWAFRKAEAAHGIKEQP